MQKLSAEESYDLIYFNQFLMYKFAKDGILQDLTDRISKSSVLKENYPAGELEKSSSTENTMPVSTSWKAIRCRTSIRPLRIKPASTSAI